MLQRYPKSVKLKDGNQVIIKLLGREDFEFSLGFFRRQPEQDRIYLRRDTTKREKVEERLVEIESGNAIGLIVIADGMIVADANLSYAPRGWFRKTGEIRLVVDVNYRRRGLGSILVAELIELAKERGLIKLAAECMDQQLGIQGTLKSLGFEEEGVLRRFVLDNRQEEHDLVMLGLQL